MLTGSERLSVSMEPGRISLQRAIGQSCSALAHISTGHEIWSSGSLTRSSIVGDLQRATDKLAANYLAFIQLASDQTHGCALMSSRPSIIESRLAISERVWNGIRNLLGLGE